MSTTPQGVKDLRKKIKELQKVAQVESLIIEKTGFAGKMYVSTSLDVISPKDCTKETLSAFLAAFPPLPVFFYSSGCAGIDTMEKIKNPETIKNEVLGGVWIDCQNEKYLPAPPKVKWVALVNDNPTTFWAEMAEGEISGGKVSIKVEPSEYEKGLRDAGRKFETTAPIFRPNITLTTCSFYGGHIYHYPTTPEQQEALKIYLNIK